MPALIWILIFLAILLLAGSFYLCAQAIFPRVIPYQKTYEIEVEKGKLVESEYLTWTRQEVRIQSPFGYNLAGTYLPLEGSKKTAIIVHGFIFSRLGSVKYVRLFRDRGFNVFIYDQRYHGQSGGKSTTFGYYEQHDLKAVVDWAFQQIGQDGIVGTMGESLGAATCLMHAALDPRITFTIPDCPYADLREELSLRLKLDYHLPAFPLMPLASLFCRLLAGFWFRQVSPIRGIPHIQTPVFFIHGQNDTYIPPEASQKMFAAKTNGYRRLYLAPNADHAEAYWNNRETYHREIGLFLNEIGLG